MSYTLGLDLGTTNSAAAIADDEGVRMLSIGHDGPIVSSVVHLATDGSFTVGRAAERRAETDPAGVAREFKRRFGDTTPFLLHGTPVAANDLTLRLAQHLVGAATEEQGERPTDLVVCHPANWGNFKVSLLSDTLTNSGLPPHRLVTEPEAAAVHYAGQSRVPIDTTVAVYDLGGGTFDVALLRKTADGWQPLGRPGGVERLGGIDFDTAVFQHVVDSLDLDLTSFDDDDIAAQVGVARLRHDCTDAKHALSSDTSTAVSVLLPGVSAQVRITRGEFESMIGPAVNRSLETFDVTIEAAGLRYDQIDRILMVGGSSRIPIVAQRVASHTGRPLATDAHPKHAIALGAAALGRQQRTAVRPPAPNPTTTAVVPPPTAPPPARPPPTTPPSTTPPPHLAGLGTPQGGLYQELPHISEGVPAFMERPTVASPRIAAPPPGAPHPPTVAPAPPRPTPTPAPRLVPPTTAAPSPRPNPVPPTPAKRRSPAAMFLIGIVVAGVAAGGAAAALGYFDRAPADPGAGTGAVVNESGCPPDRMADPSLSYRITEIAADDPDGGANIRTVPSLESTPIGALPSFTPVSVSVNDCEIDADDRTWWGIVIQNTLVWVAASLVEVAG